MTVRDRGPSGIGGSVRVRARVGVDRDREGGAQRRGVEVGLRVQAELVAMLARQRQAHRAAPVGQEKVHRRGVHLLGGVDKVAFVLSVFVIDQDNGLAGLEFVEDFGDRGKWHRCNCMGTSAPRRASSGLFCGRPCPSQRVYH